jgi:hypothetical protein
MVEARSKPPMIGIVVLGTGAMYLLVALALVLVSI